ncbi:hypothetical protein [Bacillus sp. V33-4]|uniref:hypothetical protein n=1 Tax=Bacillus sp. V33-4 TaxID=2054169 RepID=UPI000C756AFB|nr:hypothetical protein [Bacillus sp. V33-4]PLR85413.1 hypothetical protein CVD23_08530 [Bacillus sp. V33-4]
MKILFITLRALEINSSVSTSNIGLLNGLIQEGCEIDLLMPEVNPNLIQYEPVQGIYDKVNVIRFQSNLIYEKLVIGKQNKLKKLLVGYLRKIFYKVSLYDNTIQLVNMADGIILDGKKYDLVISTSDPKTSHMFADKLIKKGLNYDIWLQHWGDPLSIDITKENIYPHSYIKLKERQILSNADLIVYVSPITERLQKKGFPKYKDKMKFMPLPYEHEKIYRNVRREIITIGYFGDYNSKVRDIIPLYNFCSENPNVKLIVAGSTDISLKEKDNITVLPRITQKQINELEAQCDILACICNRSGTQIPGKIYYYAATNKPILTILDGEYKDEIRDYLSTYNRFKLCDNNIESISEKVIELSETNNTHMPCVDLSPRKIASELLNLVREKIRERKNGQSNSSGTNI